MNDKDLEAFDKWFKGDLPKLPEIHDAYERHIWQAALNWERNKAKKFDETEIALANKIIENTNLMDELGEYKEAARSEAEEVNRLQAENKKLRGALKTSLKTILELWEMPDVVHLDEHGEAINQAKEALKEIGTEC